MSAWGSCSAFPAPCGFSVGVRSVLGGSIAQSIAANPGRGGYTSASFLFLIMLLPPEAASLAA